MKQLIIITLAITLVSSCGWRLRGSLASPSDLTTVYLTTKNSHGNLATDIKRLLQSNDITIAPNSTNSQYTITIDNEQDQRRTVSVGSNALAAEYELTLEADYHIQKLDDDKVSVPTTARVVRSFNFDVNDVVGKTEEERLIRTEMRRELAQQIIRRLFFIAQSSDSADHSSNDNPPGQ